MISNCGVKLGRVAEMMSSRDERRAGEGAARVKGGKEKTKERGNWKCLEHQIIQRSSFPSLQGQRVHFAGYTNVQTAHSWVRGVHVGAVGEYISNLVEGK